MITQKHVSNNAINVFAGLLVGGLAGATTMLLIAPQPGKQTRAQIRQKGIELRDRTVHSMDDAVAALNANTHRITASVQAKAEELQQQGRELVIKQLDHIESVVEAGKTAVKGS